MSERICPKCRVIYGNGQRECEECGKLLKNATEEEIEEYKVFASKKINRASGKSESIIPDLWQIIAAAALVIYGIVVTLIDRTYCSLLILNIIYAAALVMPKVFEAQGYHKRFDFFARDPFWIRIRRIIILCFIGFINVWASLHIFCPQIFQSGNSVTITVN